MIPWYDKPPSRAQLRYLKNLGYVEPAPFSMAEASAAIDEMLRSGDSPAACREMLVERGEREALFEMDENAARGPLPRAPSRIVWVLAAPFVLFSNLAAAAFWLLSRFIALVGWIFSSLAALLIWFLSRIGMLAVRSAVVTAEAGRDKVIPWIGARDWRSMGAGCLAQGVAAVHQVDGLLSHASGEDRFLLLILRFATAAGAAITGAAVMLCAV